MGPKNAIIIGCNILSSSIASSLVEQGDKVYVLDPDDRAFDWLEEAKVESQRIVPIVGDGSSRKDLERANASDTDVLLALSEDDIHNAFVAQIARHIYQTRIVACRIDDRKLQKMYTAIGVHAINTADISSELFLDTAGS
jgi:Trk K+ transport system NAD-binding subunit